MVTLYVVSPWLEELSGWLEGELLEEGALLSLSSS